ncbi:MAG: type I phosphomannose isomerase catalytic subunit [Bacteroidota bacterium]
MSFEIYPLQFHPIFKDRIWGGNKLKTILNKPITSDITGESWELSTVEDNVSIVANGSYKEKTLLELIELYPESILGTAVFKKFGKQFPLLFKFLDAKEDLSIQVHPNDELAQKRHHSFGKTEMWYIMQADENAKIIVGFKEDSDATQYLKHLENKTLVTLLDQINVNVGDSFFLATGTVHAIGAGILLAEIQQTSDITYRIYDFDRVDSNGKKRELHIDLALEAINYKKTPSQKNYKKTQNQSNTIVDCPYFTTNFLPINGAQEIAKSIDSFTVYMCMEGNFELLYNQTKIHYKKGDTILIPAVMNKYILSGNASLLEIYIS